ncbi:MAG: NAD(+) synthetase [Thermoproteota archaeon]|nr:MAG: NAD(+) synthetase [Candidatus Korarchaeota archaeon]
MLTLESLKLDPEKVCSLICEFTRDLVRRAGAKGVVLGISGGVDSCTTAALMVKALGRERVLGLLLPEEGVTPREDLEDATNLAKRLRIRYETLEISGIVREYLRLLPRSDLIAEGNLKPRIRMTILYYYANSLNYLVAGSGDRSEILIGYFTKYGDGGVDFLPIGGLFKTQVRQLGAYLGVPDRITAKPSSPRLWKGHLAEKELGMTYEEIDLILHALFDLKLSVEEASRETGLERDKVLKVLKMHEESKHKREMPPIAPING